MTTPHELFHRGLPGASYSSDPHPSLDGLRQSCPVFHHAERKTWFISGYEDTARLLADERLIQSKSFALVDRTPVPRLRTFFASAERGGLVSLVERIVDAHVTRILSARHADLVADLARPVPLDVMGELLGIPASERRTLGALAFPVLRSFDLHADYSPAQDGVQRRTINPKALLRAYFHAHLAKARRHTDSALMQLLLVEQDAHQLPDDTLVDTCTKLLLAGATSTAGCLANAMERLLRPGGARELPAGGTAAEWRRAVDEYVRLASPVLATKRVATADVPVGDVIIKAGEEICLMLASANRDPALFPNADALEWATVRPSHLAFGKGPHHCLGAPLARLEIRAVLARLLPEIGRFRLQSPVDWAEAWLVHEPNALQVDIEARRV